MTTPANSPVEMCNLTLASLGERRIKSLEHPTSEVERTMGILYDNSRRYVLSLSAWNFAMKQANIQRDTTDPLFDYDQSFQLPNDFISLVSVGGSSGERYATDQYRIYEDKVYFSGDGGNTLRIRYVFDNTDLSKWSAPAKRVMQYDLAVAAAYAFSRKPGLIKEMDALYRIALSDAIGKDGQDDPPIRVTSSVMLAARLYGFSVDDDPTIVRFDDY